jgi:hypothetical protein
LQTLPSTRLSVRYLVVRSGSEGAVSHPERTLKAAVLRAIEFMANNEAGLITSIIDTKSKAIFRDIEISGFAERFDPVHAPECDTSRRPSAEVAEGCGNE